MFCLELAASDIPAMFKPAVDKKYQVGERTILSFSSYSGLENVRFRFVIFRLPIHRSHRVQRAEIPKLSTENDEVTFRRYLAV